MSKQKIMLDELVIRYPILSVCKDDIWTAYDMLRGCYLCGGKLLVAGNGGSATDAEHIVGELMKSFRKNRNLEDGFCRKIIEIDSELGADLCKYLQGALPVISLTGNVALSTACSNDINGAIGFAQQLLGYGTEKDVFLGITTSGNSQNILYALITARAKGMKTIALTGRDGGKAKALADLSVIAPENDTYKIQELHLPIYHTLCLMLEDSFFG